MVDQLQLKVKAASDDELKDMLSDLTHDSPNWKMVYDEFKIRSLSKVPNPAGSKPENPSNCIKPPPDRLLIKIAVGTFIGFLVLVIGYIFRSQLGISL